MSFDNFDTIFLSYLQHCVSLTVEWRENQAIISSARSDVNVPWGLLGSSTIRSNLQISINYTIKKLISKDQPEWTTLIVN